MRKTRDNDEVCSKSKGVGQEDTGIEARTNVRVTRRFIEIDNLGHGYLCDDAGGVVGRGTDCKRAAADRRGNAASDDEAEFGPGTTRHIAHRPIRIIAEKCMDESLE